MRFRDLRSLALALTLAVVALTPAAARAQDYTDIWWAAGGTESGWGVNFVQNENIVFATFYLYDVNKLPTWYSAAMTSTGSGSFAGPLYQTSGSFFGDPVFVPVTPAGTVLVGAATFTPTSATTGAFNYNVNNVPGRGNIVVNKQIARFSFQPILLGGNYSGVLSSTLSKCADASSNGTILYDVDPQVTQTTNGQLQILVNFVSGGSCTIAGPVLQEGQLFRVPGASYNCTFGANTSATLYEVKATSLGIEGRFVAPNIGGGCQQDASFSALLN